MKCTPCEANECEGKFENHDKCEREVDGLRCICVCRRSRNKVILSTALSVTAGAALTAAGVSLTVMTAGAGIFIGNSLTSSGVSLMANPIEKLVNKECVTLKDSAKKAVVGGALGTLSPFGGADAFALAAKVGTRFTLKTGIRKVREKKAKQKIAVKSTKKVTGKSLKTADKRKRRQRLKSDASISSLVHKDTSKIKKKASSSKTQGELVKTKKKRLKSESVDSELIEQVRKKTSSKTKGELVKTKKRRLKSESVDSELVEKVKKNSSSKTQGELVKTKKKRIKTELAEPELIGKVKKKSKSNKNQEELTKTKKKRTKSNSEKTNKVRKTKGHRKQGSLIKTDRNRSKKSKQTSKKDESVHEKIKIRILFSSFLGIKRSKVNTERKSSTLKIEADCVADKLVKNPKNKKSFFDFDLKKKSKLTKKEAMESEQYIEESIARLFRLEGENSDEEKFTKKKLKKSKSKEDKLGDKKSFFDFHVKTKSKKIEGTERIQEEQSIEESIARLFWLEGENSDDEGLPKSKLKKSKSKEEKLVEKKSFFDFHLKKKLKKVDGTEEQVISSLDQDVQEEQSIEESIARLFWLEGENSDEELSTKSKLKKSKSKEDKFVEKKSFFDFHVKKKSIKVEGSEEHKISPINEDIQEEQSIEESIARLFWLEGENSDDEGSLKRKLKKSKSKEDKLLEKKSFFDFHVKKKPKKLFGTEEQVISVFDKDLEEEQSFEESIARLFRPEGENSDEEESQKSKLKKSKSKEDKLVQKKLIFDFSGKKKLKKFNSVIEQENSPLDMNNEKELNGPTDEKSEEIANNSNAENSTINEDNQNSNEEVLSQSTSVELKPNENEGSQPETSSKIKNKNKHKSKDSGITPELDTKVENDTTKPDKKLKAKKPIFDFSGKKKLKKVNSIDKQENSPLDMNIEKDLCEPTDEKSEDIVNNIITESTAVIEDNQPSNEEVLSQSTSIELKTNENEGSQPETSSKIKKKKNKDKSQDSGITPELDTKVENDTTKPDKKLKAKKPIFDFSGKKKLKKVNSIDEQENSPLEMNIEKDLNEPLDDKSEEIVNNITTESIVVIEDSKHSNEEVTELSSVELKPNENEGSQPETSSKIKKKKNKDKSQDSGITPELDTKVENDTTKPDKKLKAKKPIFDFSGKKKLKKVNSIDEQENSPLEMNIEKDLNEPLDEKSEEIVNNITTESIVVIEDSKHSNEEVTELPSVELKPNENEGSQPETSSKIKKKKNKDKSQDSGITPELDTKVENDTTKPDKKLKAKKPIFDFSGKKKLKKVNSIDEQENSPLEMNIEKDLNEPLDDKSEDIVNNIITESIVVIEDSKHSNEEVAELPSAELKPNENEGSQPETSSKIKKKKNKDKSQDSGITPELDTKVENDTTKPDKKLKAKKPIFDFSGKKKLKKVNSIDEQENSPLEMNIEKDLNEPLDEKSEEIVNNITTESIVVIEDSKHSNEEVTELPSVELKPNENEGSQPETSSKIKKKKNKDKSQDSGITPELDTKVENDTTKPDKKLKAKKPIFDFSGKKKLKKVNSIDEQENSPLEMNIEKDLNEPLDDKSEDIVNNIITESIVVIEDSKHSNEEVAELPSAELKPNENEGSQPETLSKIKKKEDKDKSKDSDEKIKKGK